MLMMMKRELILGILGFGESHNNLSRFDVVSQKHNISIINFAIIAAIKRKQLKYVKLPLSFF